MRNLRKSAAILLTAVMAATMLVVPGEGAQAAELQENSVSYSTESILQYSYGAKKQKVSISKKERNKYFGKSAFIGSSIGVGLKSYMQSRGHGYLGNPVMLVQGCYSFANDKGGNSQYKIGYRGTKYKAKDAVKAAKVKRVFISMGTNDLWKDAKSTSKDYISYVQGIRKRNPGVVIFIESTTPICTSSNKRYLNNSAINTLNKEMKKYCSEKKDLYYVDVTKGMKDKSGGLKSQYSSDGYVHLSYSAYALWMKNLTAYVDDLLVQEKVAKRAVVTAEKTKTQQNLDEAKKKVKALENSTVKDKLKKKLKKVKVIQQTTTQENITTEVNATGTAETDNTTATQWTDSNTTEEKQPGIVQTTEKEQKGHIYKKKGKSYYKYEDGKLAKKKFVTVGKNTYYFNKKGVMEKGWMKKKGNYYYFDRQTGKQKFNCKVDGIKIRKDGTAKLSTYTKNKIDTMIMAKKIMQANTKTTDSKQKKLKKVFNWVLKHPYKRYRTLKSVQSKKGWEITFANDVYKKGQGCCVSEASAFAFLAHECGYKNVYICDDTGHAWTEINGRVYDTLFAEAKNYNKYYNSSYGTAGLHRVGKLKI